MKRLAIFIGGLLLMPAFAEVAPVFIDENDAIEYADGMYDENGFFVAPEEIVETETEADTQKMQTPVKISRAPVNATPVANRTTTTRAMPASAGATTASGRGSANGNSSRVVAARTTTSSPRATASRTVASRGTTATSPRAGTTSTRTATSTAATRAAAARATGGATRATSAATGATVARTATSTGRTTAARTATATTARAATASGRLSVDPNRNVGTALKNATITAANGTVTLNDSGGTLYNKSASIRRTPTIRMSSLNGISAETTAVSTMSLEDMDDLAELTDYCKAQYANCMDNYCNVLDDNQGRCSCSANLKNYARAEAALKTATEELQDVAQKIQYIGLTTREVETLFTETIAEETMRTSGTDTSQLQASLNKIKDMIIDVKSGTATSSASNDILGLNFDLSGLLEFSFDSTGFDLGSLFGTTNTNSVSNQRGEELYKTAAARCKSSVLKACTARGVDASLITNAYDLEIDRECMAYERSLNDSNDQMLATVRNAKNVLQKARLMVAQQKNAYDMRGCINALDACMQDEFVCGSDYENCLDPTGRYIVNGEIVVGSQPGHAIDPESQGRVASVMTSDVCRVNLYRTWDMPGATCQIHADPQGSSNYTTYLNNPTYNQNNAWGSGTSDTLSEYITQTVKSNSAEKVSENMSKYLQNKIGYVAKDGRAYGMCVSVLNKCQDYSYDGKGTSAKYKQDNDVIKQYLARVLVQIKAKQDEILANYAETCVSDVTSCLGQNGYPTEDPSDWEDDPHVYSTNTTKMNIAVNACRAQIVTCMSVNGYSIDTPTPTEMNCWVQGLLYSTSTGECMIDNIHDNPCSLETIEQCTPGTCEPTLGSDYTWCTTVNSPTCMLTTQCPSNPTSYNVTINCNGGTYSDTNNSYGTQQVPAGQSLTLTGKCTRSGYTITSWSCSGLGELNTGNWSFSPSGSISSITCTPTWSSGSATQYSYSLQCGQECPDYGFASGSASSGQSVSFPACGKSNAVTVSWLCNAFSPEPGATSFSMPSMNVNCNASCTAGTGPTPTTYSVNLTCGTGTTGGEYVFTASSGSTLTLSDRCQCNGGIYNKLSWGGDCQGKGNSFTVNNNINCTATCLGTPTPGDNEEYTIHINCGDGFFVPRSNATSSDDSSCNTQQCGNVVVESDDLPVKLNQYCDGIAQPEWECPGSGGNLTPAGYFTPAQSESTCVQSGKGSSPAAGGMRYVKIENNGGERTPRTRGNAYQLNAVWVDTDGSSVCQEPGVYIADPNTNSAVCIDPVTTIGWWVKSDSRSSGFYINVDGKDILFAREWGEIVTENISKLQNTDPDTTLVAEAKVYGPEVAYVSFDKENKTWDRMVYPTLPSNEYYVHNMFNIDFYPNRPGRSGSQDPTATYTYIEGDNYYKRNGSPTNYAPTITESGYTFRGFYPGPLSAVSSDSSTGMVWPAATGGMSPVTLSNKKWVLVTDNLNFQTLNLYAAWAKNCTNTNYCTLNIDANGGVTYTIKCPTGYTQIGTGADANCVDPNAGDWRGIEFPGATVD